MFKFLGVSFPCFNRTTTTTTTTTQSQRDHGSDLEVGSPPATLKNCVFCNASEENGFKIVYEDASFLAFEDRSPASAVHCLVVPKRHIENVRKLRSNDVELVKRMENVGHLVLDKFDIPTDKHQRRMGFHVPPFYSIHHLHLHVQALPYKSRLKALTYRVSSPGRRSHSKGLGWFAEVGQTVRILERGGKVGLLPC